MSAARGAALAKEFHRRDYRVFATSTDGHKMDSLESRGITTLELDVTSQASIGKAAALVHSAAGGKLDVLINNAAVFQNMPLADVDLNEGRKLFEVNFFGVLAVIQAFLPLLLATDGSGMVANVSSMSAIVCPTWQGMYASSKAALLAMGNTLRIELAPLDIRVVTIVSGGVDTAVLRKQHGCRVPEQSLYRPLAAFIENNESAAKIKSLDPVKYAKKVVDHLLKPQPKALVWCGAFAWLAWVLTWLGWVGMMDAGQIKKARLDQIKRPGVLVNHQANHAKLL